MAWLLATLKPTFCLFLISSTSGNLDENSIFYLMSRGLNYQQSKELLINGFLLDVIEKITDTEIKNLVKNIMGLKE